MEERALCRQWERKFLLAVDRDFRGVVYATARDTMQNVHNNGNQSMLLYEAEKSKLLEHRPHAEGSLSMCLNANKYQVIPIIPNSVLFTGSLHACEKKAIWAESQQPVE